MLAVKAVDGGSDFGILASTSTGVVSDTTWKCSSSYQTDWHLASFDDSAWSPAVIRRTNGDGPWGRFNAINAQAKWIWAHGVAGGTIYCRKSFC